MKEAQRQWEDQRSLEQLEIYVENLKKEAMDLFDKEHYEQCLGMFRFLVGTRARKPHVARLRETQPADVCGNDWIQGANSKRGRCFEFRSRA